MSVGDVGTPLVKVVRTDYDTAFLIADLLTSRITVLTGQPKAGKSLLVAAMIRALLEGDSHFLGQRIHQHLKHVVYGFTDDGADAELRERLLGTAAENSIAVLRMNGSGTSWDDLATRLQAAGCELFVLDTILGSLDSEDDIASGVVASKVIERVRPISEAGIPVLLVTHTPKGREEGLDVASSVIGGRAIAAGTRGVIALRKSAKDGLRLQTQINRARADLDLRLTVHPTSSTSEVPVWSVQTPAASKVKQKRKDSSYAWHAALADRVVADNADVTSLAALARLYDTEFDYSHHTIRAQLGRLVARVDGRWTHQTDDGDRETSVGHLAA